MQCTIFPLIISPLTWFLCTVTSHVFFVPKTKNWNAQREMHVCLSNNLWNCNADSNAAMLMFGCVYALHLNYIRVFYSSFKNIFKTWFFMCFQEGNKNFRINVNTTTKKAWFRINPISLSFFLRLHLHPFIFLLTCLWFGHERSCLFVGSLVKTLWVFQWKGINS